MGGEGVQQAVAPAADEALCLVGQVVDGAGAGGDFQNGRVHGPTIRWSAVCPRRIEVELTSDRGDGTLTWRAAGAKEPRGVLDASLLPSGVKVGDTVKADADYDMEGVTIVAVLPPTREEEGRQRHRVHRGARLRRPGTTRRSRSAGSASPATGDGARGVRWSRWPRRSGWRRSAGRRPQGDRPERPRFERPEKPKLPPKPKAPRLRAGRTHRQALLAELPEEQRPVAEQVLKGGIPAVRAAIDEQNAAAKAAGNPLVTADALLALAESLVPKARVAEWRDRAEAAIEQIDTVDLRDLRSVVTKAETAAKDESSRELAEQLRTGLATRLEKEQAAWLAEIAELLADDRVVRALNVSSRPPKAGTPLPPRPRRAPGHGRRRRPHRPDRGQALEHGAGGARPLPRAHQGRARLDPGRRPTRS